MDSVGSITLGLHIRLYLGRAYEWMDILPGNLDKELATAGYRERISETGHGHDPVDPTATKVVTNFENQDIRLPP